MGFGIMRFPSVPLLAVGAVTTVSKCGDSFLDAPQLFVSALDHAILFPRTYFKNSSPQRFRARASVDALVHEILHGTQANNLTGIIKLESPR